MSKEVQKEEIDDNKESIDVEKDKYGVNERNREREELKSKKVKKHTGLKVIAVILIAIVIIIATAFGTGYFYLNQKIGQMKQENIDKNQVGIDSKVSNELKGYKNIALLGIDSREDDYGLGNRSDCIIIASLNQDTKDVKLISVYRDTYMQVEELAKERLDKVTHAYSYGGAQNSLKSLNTNLDLNITEFVTVNFDAVISAVNALGGVSINIDSAELSYINPIINSLIATSGVSSKNITSTGTQTVDGVQAVAYSRIRSTAGGDYKRAERMRTVVEAMIKKAKTLDIAKLNSLLDTILPKISTNIPSNEIISLIPTLASVNISNSLGWPYKVEGITLDRWYGVPCTLESNVVRLHKEVFNQNDYEATENVKNISSQIVKKTGYTEAK